MKAALIQMRTVSDKAENLRHARELIDEAAKNGADICVLPEMFCCEYRNSSFIENQEPAGGPAWQMLSAASGENSVWLIGGSVPEAEGGRLYNTSFVFDRSGNQAARCRKSHLFDIAVHGGQHFKESDTFTPGDEICSFDTEFGRLGLCICFDMRFPELARIMSLDGAWAVFCPASFNMTTGPAHWEVMFRSRAVESQVYTLGCAPARDEQGSYVSYANSIAVSPWGDVLARAGAEETTLYVELDPAYVESIRSCPRGVRTCTRSAATEEKLTQPPWKFALDGQALLGYDINVYKDMEAMDLLKITEAEKKALKGRGLILTNDGEHFIARIVAPNGVFTNEQMQMVTDVARKYGDGRVALTVRLTIEIQGVSTKQVTATNFSYTGLPDRYSVEEIITQSLEVKVRGTQEVLDQIQSSNIRVVADLSEISQTGIMYVPVRVIVDGFTDAGAVGDYMIAIKIRS